MINIFQFLYKLVEPIAFYESGGSAGGTTSGGSTTSGGGKTDWSSIAGGVGLGLSGLGAVGSLAGSLLGGEEQQSIRDMYPSQTMDYTNYAMAMQRETRNKILNMLAEKSYEGYEGGKNLANVGMAAAMEGTKTQTPDYFAQAKSFAEGDEGAVGEVLASFAPSTTIYKDPSEMTEWDKLAEQAGITVTKYNDFQSQAELREALFEKNKASVEVSDMEIFVAEKIGTYVLNTLFPGMGFDKLCYAGQCDDMLNGIIRGIKAMSRTYKQMGNGPQLNPALQDNKETKET